MPGFPFVLVTTEVLQEGKTCTRSARRLSTTECRGRPPLSSRGRTCRSIHSLFQRVHDGSDRLPLDDELIQVYIPYLSDTVEVLQVRRVFKRLNRFSELIHKTRRGDEDLDSKIDAAREVLEELKAIPPLRGLLESAFPVKSEWLIGSGEPLRQVETSRSSRRTLGCCGRSCLASNRIDDRSAVDGRRKKSGVAWVRDGAVLGRGEEMDGAQEQAFELQCSRRCPATPFSWIAAATPAELTLATTMLLTGCAGCRATSGT